MRVFFIAFVIILGTYYNSFAQVFEPVKWSTSVEKISETEFNLISTATIDAGWHLYSQDVPENGPVPTSFIYDDEGGKIKVMGNTMEEEGHTVDDPVFEMRIKYFENKAVFKQKIELNASIKIVNAFVEFMVCDDEKCLPPTEENLTFNISTQESIKNHEVNDNSETHAPASDTTNTFETKKENKKSLWGTFIIAFLFGFHRSVDPVRISNDSHDGQLLYKAEQE